MKMTDYDKAHSTLHRTAQKPIKIKASHKGLFTEKAHKAGKSVQEYAAEEQHAPGKLGKEARFARTFGGRKY